MVLLYRGLAVGRMAIVAPTAAVTAIALVSSSHPQARIEGRRQVPAGLPEGVGAGIGFALFFVCLANTTGEADLWPLLAPRVSIAVAAVAGVAMRTSLRPATGAFWRIAAVGILDMVANLLYVLALRRGLLSIVAVLVSLYPVSTVVLARFVLHERLTRPQLAGLAAAAAGVALIAAV